MGRLGVEVDSRFEFNFIMVFGGTQPNVSYTDLDAHKGEEGYVPINFPYYGALFTYKL
jgi:hypothetical protein